MNDALYFPIHRAKAGEITGVGQLRRGGAACRMHRPVRFAGRRS